MQKIQPEMETLLLGEVCADRRHVAVLQHKPRCSPQLRQNAATAAAKNPPPTLVPASALSALIIDVRHGVLPHVICWHIACQIDDNSFSKKKISDKQ